MWIANLCIRRPVLAIVMAIVLVLLGIISFLRLPVREYPDIETPVVSVSTVYPGANPETVETTVTEILEDELISIDGVKTLSSTSKEEVSNIVLEFELDKDVDIAAQDARDRIARARGRLPDDIEEPIILKQDAEASAIMWLGLAGPSFSRLQLSDYADKYIVDQLQTVKGVGRVIIGGERAYAMRIWLDPSKMVGRHISIKDVEQALRNENIELPSGRIESNTVEFSVRTQGDLTTPAMFNQLVIKTVDNVPIYLRDIGRAEIGARSDRSFVRYNNQPAVGLGIVKQSKANTIEVAQGIRAKVAELRPQLPKGMILEPAYDAAIFIERSIENVYESLIIAGLLVVLVIFFFLRNFKATLIPAVTIPVSIIATFTMLYALDFSINTFTLLALTLAIGLVVDDAIIVLENIYRHIEMGESPWEAAVHGTQEIGFAVIATTVVLVAVFVPIGFMPGIVGKLLTEFSLAVAGAVVISSFIALTLAPMLCSRFLTPPASKRQKTTSKTLVSRIHTWVQAAVGSFQQSFEHTTNFYHTMLTYSLSHTKTMVAVAVGFISLSGLMIVLVPSDFLPIEDRGSFMSIVSAPEGSTLQYTDRAIKQAERIIQAVPEVQQHFSVVALSSTGPGQVNSGIMFTRLKLWEKRHRKQQDIVAELQPKVMQIPEAWVFTMNPPSSPIPGSFRPPVQLVLQGFDTTELYNYAQSIMTKASQVPGLINVDSDLKLNKPQIEVDILRERSADLGISTRDISRTLQVLLGSQEITTFRLQNKRYDVMVQADKAFRNLPKAIEQLSLPNAEGNMVQLSNVVDIHESAAPNALPHYNRLRSVTISANNLPFLLTLGEAIDKMTTIAQEVVPPTIQIAYAGESKEYKEANSTFLWMLLLALLFVYLALSAQFDSFKHPLIILVTVPLAISGALITLFFANESLNVFSKLGIILLIGLVTKNGILIVEYANQLCETKKLLPSQAVFEAAKIRFRPVMMTAIATIFGALPIAFASGAGSESRNALGIAIVGGMLFSTFLTLVIIPVTYQLFNPDSHANDAT